jgi:outer membrane receptor protein involved in Fe transport
VGEGVFESDGKNDDTVFKIATQYHFTDDKMVYALYSEGFRLGGHNSPRAAATGMIPAQYGPDSLKNYEAGLKSEWFDNSLVLNVTVFLMEWSDIQINTDVPDTPEVNTPWWLLGTFNGETGESLGAEINFEWQATENLSFEGSLFFANAEYTADTYIDPEGDPYLEEGQEMPNSPGEKYWLAVEYTVPEVLGGDLWFRYDTSYQGESWSDLDAARLEDPAGRVPSWKSSNLQAGLSLENGWEVSLMARNVWDDRGVSNLYYSDEGYYSDWFDDPRFKVERTIQQPRTYGLSVTKRF